MDNKKIIDSILNDERLIILDNEMSVLEFVDGEEAESSLTALSLSNEVPTLYTNYVFYEILSRITKTEVDKLKENSVLVMHINFNDFLNTVGKDVKNSGYIIDAMNYLHKKKIVWFGKDAKGNEKVFSSSIIYEIQYVKNTGHATLLISSNLAKRIIVVNKINNVSFEKKIIFNMSNISAIKLYPFFRRWVGNGVYKISIERFKEMFNFNNKGYLKWSNFKRKVIDIIVKEINEHSDINISYTTTGKFLDSKKPRVTGLIFHLSFKKKALEIQEPEIKKEEMIDEQASVEIIEDYNLELEPVVEIVSNSDLDIKIKKLVKELSLTDVEFNAISEKLNQNYIRIYEVLKGLSLHKKKVTVHNNFAFLFKSFETLGVGIYQKENNQINTKPLSSIKRDEILAEKIKADYTIRRDIQNNSLFNTFPDDVKKMLFEKIKTEQNIEIPLLNKVENYHLSEDKLSLNQYGINEAVDIYYQDKENGKEWRQNQYKKEINEMYGLKVLFDGYDTIII